MINIKHVIIILLSVISFNTALARKKKSDKPNVVVIFTDDHRYSGVYALGKQAVRTPNLDKLVENGMVFHEAYLMGSFSGATCMPSRAMLQTGRNLFQLKALGRTIPEGMSTMGETFHAAGYHSHIVGKWHQDHKSLSRSFDSGDKLMGLGSYLTDHYRMPYWDFNKNGSFPAKDAYLLEYNNVGERIRRPLAKTDKRGPTANEFTGPHTSEIFAENAVKFINNYDSKKPYFMYVAFHAPHDPRQAPAKYKEMYPENEITLPPSYMPQHPFDNGHIVLRDEELAPWPRTPEIARKELSDYYAIITHLDKQIGKVIQAIKDNGDYDNTLIVFSGDSGLGVGCHGLLGKQNIYNEDGIHVPLVFTGGVIKEHKDFNALCYIYDIFPTICDITNVDMLSEVEGKSLKPVMEGKQSSIRDYTYHAYRQHQRAIRMGDYKLIEYVRANDTDRKRGEIISGSRVTQLFNIIKDPWETHNLADFPDYSEKVAELRKELQEKAKIEGDDKTIDGVKVNFWDFY